MSLDRQDPLQIPVSNSDHGIRRELHLDVSTNVSKTDQLLLSGKLAKQVGNRREREPIDGEPTRELSVGRTRLSGMTTLQIERVIGDDDRIQIKNTTDYPYRAIAQLTLIAANGDRYLGTGWFIGPRILITAGHNLFNEETKEWFEKILVTPGKNGKLEPPPFGIVESQRFYSVKGWVDRCLPSYDYGCIVLPTGSSIGTSVGWFGFDVLPDEQLADRTCSIAGYPGDKKDELAHTLWYDANQLKPPDRDTLHYLVDTYRGNSGSPVWLKTDLGPLAVGIHNYDDLTVNSATRITTDVAANMLFWNELT